MGLGLLDSVAALLEYRGFSANVSNYLDDLF
jgi:hypothetical protein